MAIRVHICIAFDIDSKYRQFISEPKSITEALPKEDSEIFQGYSAINPNINDDKPGSGNQQTDKVKFRTSRRRKRNSGEYFLNNILGNNQQGISNERMNMLSPQV